MQVNKDGERVYNDAVSALHFTLKQAGHDVKNVEKRDKRDIRVGDGKFIFEYHGARFEVEITNLTERQIRSDEYREGVARKEAANRRAMSIQGRVFSLLDKAGIGKETQGHWGRGWGDRKPYYRLDRIAKEDGTAKCILDFYDGRKGDKSAEGSAKELRKQAKALLEADGYRVEIVNKTTDYTPRSACQLHVYPKET